MRKQAPWLPSDAWSQLEMEQQPVQFIQLTEASSACSFLSLLLR